MSTSVETSNANVQRMLDFIEKIQEGKRMELFDDFTHPDIRDHPTSGEPVSGREKMRAMLSGLHASISDIKVEVLQCIGQGDMVATNKIISGRADREFAGMPAGEKFRLRVMDFVRFEDGKMVEHWATHNPLQS